SAKASFASSTSSTDRRAGMFPLISGSFHAALWAMDSSSMLPRVLTTKRAAASGSVPRALTHQAQPPRAVMLSPPGGGGSGITPKCLSGALRVRFSTSQTPVSQNAAYSALKAETMSPLAGMVIRAATGKSVIELLDEKIMQPLRLEQNPYYLTDGYGVAFVLGGLNMRTR